MLTRYLTEVFLKKEDLNILFIYIQHSMHVLSNWPNAESFVNCQVWGLRCDQSLPVLGPRLYRVRSGAVSHWVQVTVAPPAQATSLPPPPTLLCQTGEAINTVNTANIMFRATGCVQTKLTNGFSFSSVTILQHAIRWNQVTYINDNETGLKFAVFLNTQAGFELVYRALDQPVESLESHVPVLNNERTIVSVPPSFWELWDSC